MIRAALILMGLSLAFHPSDLSAADGPQAIEPGEAKQHAGKEVVVTFDVKTTKTAKSGYVYLDSESDFKDPKNLAVSISAGAVKKFETAGIADTAVYYRGKRVRVTGKIKLFEERAYLNVNDPKQIAVLDKP